MNYHTIISRIVSTFLLISLYSPTTTFAQDSISNNKKNLQLTDIMKFREIKKVQLSDDGKWLAFEARPDRGDSIGYLKSTDGSKTYKIPQGSSPQFSPNNLYAAFTISPSLLKRENASRKEKKALKKGLQIISLKTGTRYDYKNVKSYRFSPSSHFIALQFEKSEEDKNSKPLNSNREKDKPNKNSSKKKLYNSKQLGLAVSLINLKNNKVTKLSDINQYEFSNTDDWLVYSTSSQNGEKNGLFALELNTQKTTVIIKNEALSLSQMKWNKKNSTLAFIIGNYHEKANRRSHNIYTWSPKRKLKELKLNKNYTINQYSQITWSDNSQHLYFGASLIKPFVEKNENQFNTEKELYDIEKILSKKSLQLWHGKDLEIKSRAKVSYTNKKKEQILIHYNTKSKKLVTLGTKNLHDFKISNNQHALIAIDDIPYKLEQTWQERYFDAYHININNGKKTLIEKALKNKQTIKVSPNGRYVTYFKNKHLWVFDNQKNTRKNLTKNLATHFFDEDNDYPSTASAYGVFSWLDGSNQFIAYDKFDIWLFSIKNKKPINLTQGFGRELNRQLRVVKTDNTEEHLNSNQLLLVTSYNTENKQFGLFNLNLKTKKLHRRIEGNKRYRFISKAKKSDTIIYTREDFKEFPDLWVSNLALTKTKKITDINPQINHFHWGKSELIEWKNGDGKRNQGVLIKPANYDPNKQYPVLVYYYRIFSNRLFYFNQMRINHRPNLAYYTSNGYAVFLPDIHFTIGTPGQSAVKSLVPGVQKLIDMGIADPDAIGLHGHSWSGYQTAFAITQTDIFKAAVAGAPVSNMTSAYSGIRLGSGRARQFQYETGQSRIGASLWESRELYIENSPVFFADRINTPLLIQFGDKDDAVPWQQGIELYLAMRRLNKPVVMLQYENEPHHLKQYSNKLDYSIKMKSFFDHHLKGEQAPDWINTGIPYTPHSTQEN
ncbi:prolyl oligopeptidase family serine peptidase [Aliikangiella sp. IMCC44359]|uniref:prolyl oligopeptidase family serine peptidase n=1 Tax=Aliikangiella sp. IMCC44359 TaxID=3459125 RepID=UPI00403AEEED